MLYYLKNAIIGIIIILMTISEINSREVSMLVISEGYIKYKFFINHSANKYKVDYCLITAIAAWESEFNPNATYYGCNGLMQVNGGSFNVIDNLNHGTSILRKCFKTFPKDTLMALTAYNRGIAGAKRLGKPNYFAKKVYELFKLTRLLYEGWKYE
jgi:soluble lytic murein transglycosylase-like protein